MLVHIVPATPPAVNGLGDYCYKLWEHWPAPKPDWHCLAVQVPQGGPELWPEVGISSFTLSRAGLVQALEEVGATSVVLHYVGYAYHPKGCPVWLAPALMEWKRRTGGRLVVMFHELYAKGSPRQSSYWLAPFARKIVADLAGAADKWITNCVAAEDKLLAETNARPDRGKMIPVGSNIPRVREVDAIKPWPLSHGRKLKIVVFGLPATRRRTLAEHRNLLRHLCHQELVESVTLAGKADDARDTALTNSFISGMGFEELWRCRYGLSTPDLSSMFLEQDLGLVPNSPALLTKSTVYATFCTHGTTVVAVQGNGNTDTFAPALLNDDAHPEVCMKQLADENTVGDARQRTLTAAKTVLSWESIVREWQECVA